MGGGTLNAASMRKQDSAFAADALSAREIDGLVSRLLTEINLPFTSLSKRVLGHVADLKKILSTDYGSSAALPSKELLRELARIVESDIKSPMSRWQMSEGEPWARPELLIHLNKVFGGRQLQLRAHPYLEGAGLALRGFFCRAEIGEEGKFVIFLNTAHHPGAVVATFGHEIGHYLYGSLVGEKTQMTAFLEGTFSKHLTEESELFADSLVALSAYSRELIKDIGALTRVLPGESEELFARLRSVYALIGPRFNLDLSKCKMGNAWRIRYLTSMTHFFKLRCALLQTAGL